MTGGVILEILTLFIIFLVGIFAGTINIVSAGGSLIVLPLLIFFGLQPLLLTPQTGLLF